jgi:hypothetical protein
MDHPSLKPWKIDGERAASNTPRRSLGVAFEEQGIGPT